MAFHHMSAYVACVARVALSRVTCMSMGVRVGRKQMAHKDTGCRMRLYGYLVAIVGWLALAWTDFDELRNYVS